MKLIESKTLGSAQASIEFTSIPQTFTDLVLLVSARSTADNASGGSTIQLRPNSATANQTMRRLIGTGSSVVSTTDTSIFLQMAHSGQTSNTFGNTLTYIPNYTGSANKSFSVDSVQENNATDSLQVISAGLWSDTAAITSILLVPNGGNFIAGTIVSLYGVLKGSDGIVTTSP
jgi:hypothetical protein